ncbi:hypothetical protein VT84_06325 [Gemmata sp. SH-PL17]|nr:hypothetical protein VT84_06325 [Gemmata sp. SH-PL17]
MTRPWLRNVSKQWGRAKAFRLRRRPLLWWNGTLIQPRHHSAHPAALFLHLTCDGLVVDRPAPHLVEQSHELPLDRFLLFRSHFRCGRMLPEEKGAGRFCRRHGGATLLAVDEQNVGSVLFARTKIVALQERGDGTVATVRCMRSRAKGLVASSVRLALEHFPARDGGEVS